ncbi:hypothetical protein [Marinobacter bohaiensis]|uniref:hypothetical protein n=1 Tax=Marinobacter bohaiensis TaxID=2201898 RepID=UPI000DAB89E1|nr:hypothetical protein [Marinobacter bohaiensis]
MSASSSLIVEKLWRLKRAVDQGHCQGVEFIHLNNLLRDPAYREDILDRVAIGGDDELKALVREIRQSDDGQPLMATSRRQTYQTDPAQPRRKGGFRASRVLAWALPVAAAGAAMVGFTHFDNRTVHISDDIVTDTTWESGKTYVLDKKVYVDQGANLTIESGVTVRGERGSALIVTRDSKLFSRGSSVAPVVFSSNQAEGKRKRGDWGGVVLLGNAPVNQPNASIEGIPEGDTRGLFGGEDRQDSCGVMEYTRIEFAGFEVYKNNELNGLTLGGCGQNTIVQNVQVHRSLDDGIELFGGQADLKHIVITGAGDDSLDWDWGWTGRVQFLVIQAHPDDGDNGFEGDNNGDNHNAVPRSEPTFYNVTMVGGGLSAKKHRGMVIREGSGAHFHNMIMDSYGIEAIDLRDEVSSLTGAGTLTFTHNIVANTGNLGQSGTESGDSDDDYGFDEQAWTHTPQAKNRFRVESAMLPAARDITSPSFQPIMTSRQMNAETPPESEFFDESATFQGAINPVSKTTWMDDWTAFPAS